MASVQINLWRRMWNALLTAKARGIRLRLRGSQTLAFESPATIVATDGVLWLTCTAGDVVLRAGNAWRAKAWGERLVVTALTDTARLKVIGREGLRLERPGESGTPVAFERGGVRYLVPQSL